MSQVTTRKSAVSDEKEKRTDSPVKDMKKKVAANVEKEKQVAEKTAEKQPEKPKQAEKPADKNEKQKQPEKPANKDDKQKQPEKPANKDDKPKQPEIPVDKNEKQKQTEKATEKDKPAEKSADKKIEKNGVDKKTDNKEKKDTQGKKDDKADKNAKSDAKKNGERPKQNGSKLNGVDSNGGDTNGVEEPPSDDDVLEIADEEFPELAYDDNSDESPTPDALRRSTTRRGQVKAARTPETPQPAGTSDKQTDGASVEQPKDSKLLKLSEAPTSDRKLRSDDPKDKRDKDGKDERNGDNDDVIEIDDDEPRKTDTNFSKSRVKVSPYRRSTRLADQTTSSTTANYTGCPTSAQALTPIVSGPMALAEVASSCDDPRLKVARVVLTPIAKVYPYTARASPTDVDNSGNNTTMEMDITETSFAEEASLDDSSYLTGLRAIRGRRSYKPLKELSLKHVNRSARSQASTSGVSESRPTGTVVGRKRRPDSSDSIELATDAVELSAVHSKRMRLLDRIAQPFRRNIHAPVLTSSAEIVGINTDLPLTAPVAAPSTFDPETLKPAPVAASAPEDYDKKRCVVM